MFKSSKLAFVFGASLASVAGQASAQSEAPPANTQTAPNLGRPATLARLSAPQQAPANSAAPTEDETTTVGEVVVSGRPNEVRTSIDSTSYSLANDLQASTGTLADALRNVPSVEVDPDGNVSLRGDANVTILVDGRPSTQLNGASRGQLVQQLSADQYSRIEVLTNPSAAYSPEGSGGVINLITKPTTVRANDTTTGSMRANVGDNRRANIGASVAHVTGNLTLSADASVRLDSYVTQVGRVRERLDAASGQFLRARQNQDVEGSYNIANVRFSAEYNLDQKTQLVGELRHTEIDSSGDAIEFYEADRVGGASPQRIVVILTKALAGSSRVQRHAFCAASTIRAMNGPTRSVLIETDSRSEVTPSPIN